MVFILLAYDRLFLKKIFLHFAQQHRMHIETARGSAVAHQHQAAYGQGWQGMAVIMVVALVPMRKLSNLKPCLNLNFTYQM